MSSVSCSRRKILRCAVTFLGLHRAMTASTMLNLHQANWFSVVPVCCCGICILFAVVFAVVLYIH